MRRIFMLCVPVLIITSAASAKEFAIIKDSMFGSQKIEIYQSLKDALDNYSGEGKLYEIILKPVQVKRIETKKKVEVSEFKWSVDEKVDKPDKNDKTEKIEKIEKTEKNTLPKN